MDSALIFVLREMGEALIIWRKQSEIHLGHERKRGGVVQLQQNKFKFAQIKTAVPNYNSIKISNWKSKTGNRWKEIEINDKTNLEPESDAINKISNLSEYNLNRSITFEKGPTPNLKQDNCKHLSTAQIFN